MKTYIKDCRYGKFLLIHGDMISNYVNMYGEWSQAEVDLFEDILTPASNVIEVGSNIGMHTIPLSMKCSQGTVFGYEPQRPIFHVLCANVALNNRLNVVARHWAVGSEAGRIEIPTSTYDETWNYGAFSIGQGFNTEGRYQSATTSTPVDVIALDDDPLLKPLKNVDLLKIDAEGFEPQVLKGAEQLIAKHRPALFIETNNEKTFNEVAMFLKVREGGYIAYWFISNRFRQNNFNRNGFGVKGYDVNIICMHRDRPLRCRYGLTPVRDFGDLGRGVPVI